MLEVVQKIIRGRTQVMVLEPEMRKGEGYGAFALRDMTGDNILFRKRKIHPVTYEGGSLKTLLECFGNRESRKVFEKRLT